MPSEHESLRFRGVRALVTGGLGFIGSALTRRLVQEGAEVTVVDNLMPNYGGNIFNLSGMESAIKICKSDLRDAGAMRCAVANQDFVFNLAGQSSHMDSMVDPFTDLDINCSAQLVLLEACRNYNPDAHIVFASTRQIYGRPAYLPVNEAHPLNPVDINGIHKVAGETYHVLYHRVYGMRTCAMRLTNTYGPRMRIKDARQTFVGLWIRKILEGEPFEVWGGTQLRDLTYVDDVVNAFLMCACDEKAIGKVFNLGGCEVKSLKELADLLTLLNGAGSYSVREFPNERKNIDIGDYYGDYSFIQGELGWRPTVTMEEGLGKTLEYFRQHRLHYV